MTVMRSDGIVDDSAATRRKGHVSALLQTADAVAFDGAAVAAIVPASTHPDALEVAARVYKSIGNVRFDNVIFIAAGNDAAAGRINISSARTYQSRFGEVEVNDRLRNELCDEDDDIYVSEAGHSDEDGIGAQLPFLAETLGSFSAVPVVMGEESPEFCRELGNAVGEVTYDQNTLVVAVVDVLGGSEVAVDRFKTHMDAVDVSRLMALVMSEDLKLRGGGALLAAMIAAQSRGASVATLVDIRLPSNGHPGCVGAILWH